MARVETVTIQASRKVSQSYNVREIGYTVTLRMDEGEDPKSVTKAWTQKLQQAVDLAVGDVDGPTSFGKNNRLPYNK